MPAEKLLIFPLPHLAVTPEAFSFFCQFISHNYTCLSLKEATQRWSNGEVFNKPLMSITFDDGQLDNYVYGLPILEKFGLKATFFLTANNVDTGDLIWHDKLAYLLRGYCQKETWDSKFLEDTIGINIGDTTSIQAIIKISLNQLKKKPRHERLKIEEIIAGSVSSPRFPDYCGMMTWSQAKDLISKGHEIGCHTMTHDLLIKENTPNLHYEVHNAKELIEDKIDMPIRSFAYPNGDFDDRTIEAVKLAGFELAVTTKWGRNTRENNPFSLKRMELGLPKDLSWRGHYSSQLLSWRLSKLFNPKR
ncbi:MAG: polysaccharide deacetylase family protein [Chlorobium sp.]|nr:polysaccharide deacetylase family protein [Chlorobium sp.]